MTTEDTALVDELVMLRVLRSDVPTLAEKILLATKWPRGSTYDEKVGQSFQLAEKFLRYSSDYLATNRKTIEDVEAQIAKQLKSVTQPTTEEHGNTDD